MTTTIFTKITKSKYLPFVIIALGILLRFFGIWWNLPKIYHPDENALISGGLGLRIVSNLKHFEWPHLQMYISLFAISIWAKITDIYGLLFNVNVASSTSILLSRPASFFLVVRFVSFLFSSFSLVIFYKGVKNLFGNAVALVSVLIFCLSLQNIEDAHYATLESALTFWVILVFYFSQKIFKGGGYINYILAGLFAGFATSTKYNGGLSVLLIFSAHISCCYLNKQSLLKSIFSKNIFLSAIFAILGFFIGTPYALLDMKTFLRSDSPVGAMWQFKRQKAPLSKTLLNFELAESRFKLEFGRSFGVVPTVFIIIGLWKIIKLYKKKIFFMLLFPLFYFWYLGTFKLFYSQYFNPILPFFGIIIAIGVIEIYKDIKQLPNKNYLLLFKVILIASALHIFAEAVRMNYVFIFGDTRRLAENWIMENVKPGSTVGISGAYSVKLDDFNGKTGHNGVLMDRVFRSMDREIGHDKQIEYFKSQSVYVAVSGDYGLDKRLREKFSPNCRYPDGDSWAIDSMEKIKIFYPRSYIEPTVVVFGIEEAYKLKELGIILK